jgi:serine/threonine protein phosphatase 1
VGDIHGCWDEFEALLDAAALTSDDPIISVGDMVDRGPQSPRVLTFFRDTPNARAVMGNHERKHVRAARGETNAGTAQIIAGLQFGEAYDDALTYMATLPLSLSLDQVDIVHGFFEPGIPLRSQRANVIVGTMSGETYLKATHPQPWYALYDGEKPLVVGHRNYLGSSTPLLYPSAEATRVFGLDTGCVYGGALSGLLLPDFRIITVPSRANHWSDLQQEYDWINED